MMIYHTLWLFQRSEISDRHRLQLLSFYCATAQPLQMEYSSGRKRVPLSMIVRYSEVEPCSIKTVKLISMLYMAVNARRLIVEEEEEDGRELLAVLV